MEDWEWEKRYASYAKDIMRDGGMDIIIKMIPSCCSQCQHETPWEITTNIHYSTYCGHSLIVDSQGNRMKRMIRKDKRESEILKDCPLKSE